MAKKASGEIYQLKITLKNVKPPVWRRVQVADCALPRLDDILQDCMGWGHSHMHSFEIDGEEYAAPDPEGMMKCADERKMKLSKIAASGIKVFTFTYDFGDSWEHTIAIEKTLPPEPAVTYPRCTEGARACPPEDCGGAWGYDNFLIAIKDPKNPEHDNMLEWIGGAFDPEAFDIDTVNKRLRF